MWCGHFSETFEGITLLEIYMMMIIYYQGDITV